MSLQHRIAATRCLSRRALSALLLGFILFLGGASGCSSPSAEESGEKILMEVFWGATCIYCKQQKPFLADLQKRYPQLNIVQYEVHNNQSNQELYDRRAAALNTNAHAVPAVFIAGMVFVGESPEKRIYIEDAVKYAIERALPEY